MLVIYIGDLYRDLCWKGYDLIRQFYFKGLVEKF